MKHFKIPADQIATIKESLQQEIKSKFNSTVRQTLDEFEKEINKTFSQQEKLAKEPYQEPYKDPFQMRLSPNVRNPQQESEAIPLPEINREEIGMSNNNDISFTSIRQGHDEFNQLKRRLLRDFTGRLVQINDNNQVEKDAIKEKIRDAIELLCQGMSDKKEDLKQKLDASFKRIEEAVATYIGDTGNLEKMPLTDAIVKFGKHSPDYALFFAYKLYDDYMEMKELRAGNKENAAKVIEEKLKKLDDNGLVYKCISTLDNSGKFKTMFESIFKSLSQWEGGFERLLHDLNGSFKKLGLGYKVTNYDARLAAITSFRHLIRDETRDQYLGLQ